MSAAARAALVALMPLLAGCLSGRANPEQQSRRTADSATAAGAASIGLALQQAEAGEHAKAEQTLAALHGAQPSTSIAFEAAYYRILLELDPQNREGTTREAVQLADAYLGATGYLLPRRTEVHMLRRLAIAREQGLREVEQARATVKEAESRVATAPPEELQRLREELARTQAELERVRRRLGTGRP